MKKSRPAAPPTAARPQARTARAGRARGKQFIEGVQAAYAPDEEFQEKHVRNLVTSFLESLKPAKEGEKGADRIAAANLLEVNRFGALRVRKINSTEEFHQALKEAEAGKDILRRVVESGVKFREARRFSEDTKTQLREIAKSEKFREDFSIDGSSSSDPFNEFIPIMGGPFSHQLYLHDFLDGLAKAFEAWNHNPLAHQVVKITTHFVLGRGVNYNAADPLVLDSFTAWWKDQVMGSRLDTWSDSLTRDGELLIRRFVNAVTKTMFVRWVDPSTIWEIVTDLEDIERVFYYHQQYPTAYQVLYGAPAKAKFNPSNFESSKYVINQIPADEMHHIKINCAPNEKRGRSDLFSILGWLKRYKDFHTAVVLRAIGQASFTWKNKLSGTDADVDAFISQFGTEPPQFGSVYVENEASTLEPMAADLGSGTGLSDCPGVVNAVAVGSGIPKEYLGLSDHGTRAGAVVASEPGVKKFQARQLLLGRLLVDLSQEWFKLELESGRIPATQPKIDDGTLKTVVDWLQANVATYPMLSAAMKILIRALTSGCEQVPTDGKIEFEFPEIAIEDRSAKLKDIALVKSEGYFSKRRAANMSAKELGATDYDFDDEMDDIADEAAEVMASAYATADALGAGLASTAPAATAAPEDPAAPAGGLPGAAKRSIKRNAAR